MRFFNINISKKNIVRLSLLFAVFAGVCVTGCDKKFTFEKKTNYISPERADKGIVYILPGIEGESSANHQIRKGLNKAGIEQALIIYNWGFPLPGIGLLVNQTDVAGNRRAGAKLAEEIFEYQQKYPGRPVYIIGHSGGGGVAVFTLESLGKVSGAKPVDGVFLLSASLSSNYDLSQALRMTRKGIVNCSNPDDIALLKNGTRMFGNVDGGKGNSCGRTGFSRSWPKVWEVRLSARRGEHVNPHYVFTREDTIARGAPPWLLAQQWPPAAATNIKSGPRPKLQMPNYRQPVEKTSAAKTPVKPAASQANTYTSPAKETSDPARPVKPVPPTPPAAATIPEPSVAKESKAAPASVAAPIADRPVPPTPPARPKMERPKKPEPPKAPKPEYKFEITDDE